MIIKRWAFAIVRADQAAVSLNIRLAHRWPAAAQNSSIWPYATAFQPTPVGRADSVGSVRRLGKRSRGVIDHRCGGAHSPPVGMRVVPGVWMAGSANRGSFWRGGAGRDRAAAGGQDVGGGCGERGFEPVDQLVAGGLVDHERRCYEQPVAVAAGVLAAGVQQQPVVEAVPEDDCGGVGVFGEAAAGLLVGNELQSRAAARARGRRRSSGERLAMRVRPARRRRRAGRILDQAALDDLV